MKKEKENDRVFIAEESPLYLGVGEPIWRVIEISVEIDGTVCDDVDRPMFSIY